MRLVLIEWLDSYGCSSQWQDLQGASPAPLTCKSVGWLVHDADDCKVLDCCVLGEMLTWSQELRIIWSAPKEPGSI